MLSPVTGTIYVLRNRNNGKCYVGQTTTALSKRIYQHGKNPKMIVGRAIRKYGADAFEQFSMSGIPSAWLDYAEIAMIERTESAVPKGYNVHLGGQANRLFSDATKARISAAKKGTPSPNRGKKLSEKQKAILRACRLGSRASEETRAKLSAYHLAHPVRAMLGKHHSLETRKKMSESAKKVIHTEEWNCHVGEAQKGKILSPETIEKIRVANTGKSPSMETREKLRQAQLKRGEVYNTSQSARMKAWWSARKSKEAT